MTELIRYDAMCLAIAAAHAVDEVKDLRDRAAALELYAKQAKNEEAECRCREIRERAERRWGQLYAAGPKARPPGPGRGKLGHVALPSFNGAPKLDQMGVTKRQAAEWQARAAIPEEQFETTLAAGKSTDILLKNQRREQREIELGEQTIVAAANLGTKLYNVIYADPPWRFEPYSRETGMDRAADNHYPTMDRLSIMSLPVPAADDCILFLWATAPMLPQALDVIRAWGFEYKTHCIWVKERIGTGYWYRSLHELLLVATRGNVPAPPADQRLPSVFHEPTGRHSQKPPAFAEFIEAWFPHLPKVEMFARQPRAGWEVWGNEVASP